MDRAGMMRGVTAALLLVLCVGVLGCSRAVAGDPRAENDRGPGSADLAYAQPALDRLLLTDAQIATIMRAKAMSGYRTYTDLPTQPGEVYSDPQCAVALFNTTVPAYRVAGYVSVRGKKIAESAGSDLYHDIDEAVVAFQSPSEATTFVDNATKAWQKCAGMNVAYTDPRGQLDRWKIGVPRTVGQIIAVNNTSTDQWSCGHAMTARANLVVDVDACGYTITDQAISIVKAIATVAQ